MNDDNAIPSGRPQQNPDQPVPPTIQPSRPHAEEVAPIRGAAASVEAILRQPWRVLDQLREPGSTRLILGMVAVAVLCGLVYGVVVGTFSNGRQLWAAPIKIAGGLLISAIICLPSLYILACLSGSQARFKEICGLVAGLLLLTTILLIGFAPVAWLFSQSTNSVIWMGLLHLTFWFIATGFGLRFLANGFMNGKARSNAGLNTWVVIFLLVACQMSTALRPIVGTAPTLLPEKKSFFVSHWIACVAGKNEHAGSPAAR